MTLHGILRKMKQFFRFYVLEGSTPRKQGKNENAWTSQKGPNTSISPDTTSVPTKSPCPPGFTFFKSSQELCYILVEDKHPYPPRCPYNNSLAHDYDPFLYEIFKNEVIWVRAFRKIDDVNLAPFVWTEPSERYGQTITNYEYNSVNLFLTNCMTIYNYTLRATNCSENHKALCIYSASPAKISRYCSDKNPGLSCINANLDIDSGNCFCQKAVFGLQTRNDVCDSLAEPRQLYQSLLILGGFPNSDTCWFGLYQMRMGNFLWSSDNSEVSYFLWTTETNFYYSYAAFVFKGNPGWILTPDRGLTCGLCQVSVQGELASVQTYFSTRNVEDTRFLTVVVTNPTEISNYFGRHFALYCFSNMNSNGLFEKITRYVPDVPTDTNQYIYKIFLTNAYPALYWCEGFSHPNMTVIQSKPTIAYYHNNVYRTNYAIHVFVRISINVDPFKTKLHVQATEAIRNMTEKTYIVLAVRPISFIIAGNGYFEIIIHLSTQRNDYSLTEEYDVLQNSLKGIDSQHRYIHNISTLLNSYFCMGSFTYSSGMNLTWPNTTIGSTVIPVELCIQEDGSPVTRTCEGNFTVGGQWSEVSGSCAQNYSYPQSLLELHGLFHNGINEYNRSDEILYTLVQNISNPLMIEFHLISQILNVLIKEHGKYDGLVLLKTVSATLDYDHDLMKKTQLKLNSTDVILNVVDTLTSNPTSSGFSESLILTDNIIIKIQDLSYVRGVALYKKSDFQKAEIITLYANTSEEILYDENVEAAVFIPNATYEELVTYFTDVNITMAVTFFSNHRLFNCDGTSETGNSVPISVIIPGLKSILFSPVIIAFKSNKTTDSCAYWQYGQNRLLNNIKGRWDSENIVTDVNRTRVICQSHHLTHFSVLVLGSSSGNGSIDLSTTDRVALEVITIVGSVLSFSGLLAILLTAVIFKRWRKHNGNTIILNFSVCLTAQMCLTFVADNIDVDGIECFVAAIFLHYFMISEFCWMMVIAFLQYRKFVTVFQQPTPHLIAKVSIIGWLLPLIPVAVVNIVSLGQAYHKNSYGLCYPTNNFYTYGVVLPIGIMVVINVSIFVLIMKNVCSRKVEAYGANGKDMKLQFLLALLLFFLLGLSWAFGLLTALSSKIFFAYLFCITATLQGFVMFIFFIVMNDNARSLWLGLEKICCLKENPDAERKASAHFSTTSISTLSGALDESKIK
ncbi:adhesion G-protein coupled receptor G6-like isoform X2 [Agrilus planipennis]|uniref:Adhesion G-protein coupled receptor G6-like isoform X2 n=1 Tax=Agrilus planipennis TaxID=224129 RepID=A0A7F5RMX6_AGRPL|nr:adhesion G-protein coupled receptor G6-like isoform X2 [Agrilus planipennis]